VRCLSHGGTTPEAHDRRSSQRLLSGSLAQLIGVCGIKPSVGGQSEQDEPASS
jgi:hypothetical protein